MEDREFQSIEFMFNERDRKSALEKSLDKKSIRVEKKSGRYKVNVIALILAGLLVVGAVKGAKTIKVKESEIGDINQEEMLENDSIIDSIDKFFSRNDQDSELNMENLSKEIGSLVYVKNADFNEKYDTTKVSIIAQCSHYTNDHKDYFYNVDDMARKTFDLGDRVLIDYTIVANLRAMEKAGTLNNEVQINGKTNANAYLEACQREAKNRGIDIVLDNNIEDYIRLKNCNSFKDLVELEEEKAEYVNEVVKQEQLDRGIIKGANRNA